MSRRPPWGFAILVAALLILALLGLPSIPRIESQTSYPYPIGGGAAPLPANQASAGAVSASSAGSSSGAFATSVPIVVPAFHGLEPNLQLSYSSTSGNGPFGVGWSLQGLQYITRESMFRGAASYSASDRFQLNGEDLVPCPPAVTGVRLSGTGCAGLRPAIGPMARVYITRTERHWFISRTEGTPTGQSSWMVTTPDGTVARFEPDVELPLSNSGRVWRWHLVSVTDLRGNSVGYAYTTWNNAARQLPVLTGITYGPVRVSFYYEDRPDPVASSTGGSVAILAQRLSSVAVTMREPVQGGTKPSQHSRSELIRAYSLKYGASQSDGDSLLTAVRQYGSDATVDSTTGAISGTPLPDQTFSSPALMAGSSWSEDVYPVVPRPRLAPGSNPTSLIKLPTDLPRTFHGHSVSGDFDGDGRADVLLYSQTGTQCSIDIAVLLAADPTRTTKSVLTLPEKAGSKCIVAGTLDPATTNADSAHGEFLPVDLTGFGRADLVISVENSEFGPQDVPSTEYFVTYLSNGDGTFSSGPTSDVYTDLTSLFYPDDNCVAGDTRGNRRTAIVCTMLTQRGVTKPDGLRVLYLDPTNTVLKSEPDPWPFDGKADPSEMFLGDVNGTGRDDLVSLQCVVGGCLTGATGIETAFSEGVGRFSSAVIDPITDPTVAAVWKAPTGWRPYLNQPLWVRDGALTDLTGNRRSDFAAFAGLPANTDGYLVTALSHGDGHWTYVTQRVPSTIDADNFSGFAPMWGDTTGSGRSGFLYVYQRTSLSPCDMDTPEQHPEIVEATSNGDGTFQLPSSLDRDCQHTIQVAIPWTDAILEDPTGLPTGFYSSESSDALDFNGDNVVDTYFVHQPLGAFPAVVVVPTTAQDIPPGQWQSVAAQGDGKPAFFAVDTRSATTEARTIVASTCSGGSTTSCFSDRSEKLQPPTIVPVPPGFIPLPWSSEPADWKVMDSTFTGRSSLVYINTYPVGTWPDGGTRYGTQVATYLPISDGWSQVPIVNYYPDLPATNAAGWLPADVNGDGLTDLVQVYRLNGATSVAVMLNRGNGQWSTDVLQSPEFATLRPDLTWQPMDVNGDGRADLVDLTAGQNGTTITSLLSTGSGGWDLTGPITPPVGASDTNLAHWVTGDFNGDGVADFAYVGTAPGASAKNVWTMLGNGDGTWTATAPYQIPASVDSTLGRWRSADLVGDGRTDLFHLVDTISPANLELDVLSPVRDGDFTPSSISFGPLTPSYGNNWFTSDLTGRGNASLVIPGEEGIEAFRSTVPDDRISHVSNGLGGEVDVRYMPATTWETADPLQQCSLPLGVTYVSASTITISGDPATTSPGPSSTALSYACPAWSQELRTSLGWRNVSNLRVGTQAAPALITTTTNDLSTDCGSRPLEHRLSTTSGSVLQYTSYRYTTPRTSSFSPSAECQATESDTSTCDGGTSCISDSVRYSYDPYGNETNRTETQQGVTNDTTTRSEMITYWYAPHAWLLDLPRTDSLVEPSRAGPVKRRSVKDCYDDNSASLTLKPHGELTMTSAIDPTGHARDIVTQYGYDSYGNVTQTIDPNGSDTRSQYDSQLHTSVIKTTGPSGSTRYDWNVAQGTLSSTTDFNGLTTLYYYDAYGRPVGSLRADGSSERIYYSDFGQIGSQRITTSIADGTRDGLWSTVYFDGLGRPILQLRKGGATNTAEGAKATYADAASYPYQQSNWTVVTVSPTARASLEPLARKRGAKNPPKLPTLDPTPSTVAFPANVPAESYTYDSLGRPIAEIHHDGNSRRYSYTVSRGDGERITTTDEVGNLTIETLDPWGRQVALSQADRSGKILGSGRYEYNAADELTATISSSGEMTANTWDAFGNEILSNDPNRGTATAQYDADGNPTRTVDASGARPGTSTTT